MCVDPETQSICTVWHSCEIKESSQTNKFVQSLALKQCSISVIPLYCLVENRIPIMVAFNIRNKPGRLINPPSQNGSTIDGSVHDSSIPLGWYFRWPIRWISTRRNKAEQHVATFMAISMPPWPLRRTPPQWTTDVLWSLLVRPNHVRIYIYIYMCVCIILYYIILYYIISYHYII